MLHSVSCNHISILHNCHRRRSFLLFLHMPSTKIAKCFWYRKYSCYKSCIQQKIPFSIVYCCWVAVSSRTLQAFLHVFIILVNIDFTIISILSANQSFTSHNVSFKSVWKFRPQLPIIFVLFTSWSYTDITIFSRINLCVLSDRHGFFIYFIIFVEFSRFVFTLIVFTMPILMSLRWIFSKKITDFIGLEVAADFHSIVLMYL